MKKFIISLFVWLFWLVSFWYCSDLVYWWGLQNDIYTRLRMRHYETWTATFTLLPYSTLVFNYNHNTVTCYSSWYVFTWWYGTNYRQFLYNNSSSSIDLDFECYANWGDEWIYQVAYFYNIPNIFGSSSSSCPTCPDINTWEILSWYILESEIDINYCVENWYCPNACWSWGDYSWDLQFSNLYINDILHPWKQNIFVNIPDYITWDYNFTGDDFTIDVWSWYDMDYMNSIIKINSYRPDSWDFTNIFVSWLTLIFPYIFIALLIVFVWKLLKRIFK